MSVPISTEQERTQAIDSHLGGCYCEAQEAGRKCTRCHVLAIVDSALAEQREGIAENCEGLDLRYETGQTCAAAIRRGDA